VTHWSRQTLETYNQETESERTRYLLFPDIFDHYSPLDILSILESTQMLENEVRRSDDNVTFLFVDIKSGDYIRQQGSLKVEYFGEEIDQLLKGHTFFIAQNWPNGESDIDYVSPF
jgi:hypothetical protein